VNALTCAKIIDGRVAAADRAKALMQTRSQGRFATPQATNTRARQIKRDYNELRYKIEEAQRKDSDLTRIGSPQNGNQADMTVEK
jgi:hypothetical protein